MLDYDDGAFHYFALTLHSFISQSQILQLSSQHTAFKSLSLSTGCYLYAYRVVSKTHIQLCSLTECLPTLANSTTTLNSTSLRHSDLTLANCIYRLEARAPRNRSARHEENKSRRRMARILVLCPVRIGIPNEAELPLVRSTGALQRKVESATDVAQNVLCITE